MEDQTIQNLREALKFSPDNIPLRQHLAETLLQANRLDEAQAEYTELLKLSSESRFKFGLAKVYFHKEQFSLCNVILEEILQTDPRNFDYLLLHTRALTKEGLLTQAVNMYKRALELQPGYQNEELDQTLRVRNSPESSPESSEDAEYFVQKPKLKFSDVGGMGSVKKEIELKIIKPLTHPELYKAYGKKTGGGILLYGPPGCGKTYIAKATAGEVNSKFISVGLNDILDMWIGNSEKNLHALFEIARKHQPCILFFDEIDALGASRSDMKQSAGRHLINQFLQELDGVEGNNDGVLILGATNAPWHLDPAFRRPGRFDRIVFVPPPDDIARTSILQLKLKEKPIQDIDYESLAAKLKNYSGADIDALVDIAIEDKLEASFVDGIPKPITTKDLVNASKKHKASTQEWFATAKNYALFANDSGLYDDILTYLNIKK